MPCLAEMKTRLVAGLMLLAAFCPGIATGAATGPCYGSLGCFPTTAPWASWWRPMPAPRPPAEIGTSFVLESRANGYRFYVLHPADGVYSLDGAEYDGSKQTVFVIHGFVGMGWEPLAESVKNALLAKADVNVVLVDWRAGALGDDYLQVAANTRVVAASIVQLVQHLIDAHGASAERLHLIGWGVGAHAAGYVGKAVPGVGRITALDPAGRGFDGFDEAVRLTAADARFVDAVHTDARPFGAGAGSSRPIGHVDVYVNGGWHQEACLEKLVPQFFGGTYDMPSSIKLAIIRYQLCPQERSVELFVASLRADNCTFWAHKASPIQRALSEATGGAFPNWMGVACERDTCSPLGYDSVRYPARGVFDVGTADTAPFCLPDPAAEAAMQPFFV